MSTPSIHCRRLLLLSGGLALCLSAGCTANSNLVRSMKLTKVSFDQLPPKSTDRVAKELPAASVDEVSTAKRQKTSKTNDLAVSSREPKALTAFVDEEAADERLEPAAHVVSTASEPEPLSGFDSVDRQVELAVVSEESTDDADKPLIVEETQDGEVRPSIRFQVPPELPGSEAPVLEAPREIDASTPFATRKKLIAPLYPDLPSLGPSKDEDEAEPMWTLPDLQTTAWDNHPALAQAAAQVEVARGNMIQAGLHPNPTVGWEQDTIGPGIQGYKGPYMTQEIVTGGKLKLSRAAAAMDFENAQIAFQRMRIDIATRVRDAYFDLLVSKKRREMQRALANFTDEILRAQIDLVAGGQAAPYEPLQLRVFSMQARNAVVTADNGVVAAGRRLGAAIGIVEQQRFRVAGRADETPTEIEYPRALSYLMENHTDIRSVRNQIVQSQYLSRLEYIRPRIPNLNFYGTYQHAYGVPPFINSYNFQVGAPIPIFDQNQGNILATQSSIINRERAYAAAQNDLTGQLAAILARYDTNRALAVNYRTQILPNQVSTYRGVYSRYRAGQDVNFGDVIVAQQTLSTVMNGYGDVLDQLWQAYVDLAEVLQIEDVDLLPAWFGAL